MFRTYNACEQLDQLLEDDKNDTLSKKKLVQKFHYTIFKISKRCNHLKFLKKKNKYIYNTNQSLLHYVDPLLIHKFLQNII